MMTPPPPPPDDDPAPPPPPQDDEPAPPPCGGVGQSCCENDVCANPSSLCDTNAYVCQQPGMWRGVSCYCTNSFEEIVFNAYGCFSPESSQPLVAATCAAIGVNQGINCSLVSDNGWDPSLGECVPLPTNVFVP